MHYGLVAMLLKQVLVYCDRLLERATVVRLAAVSGVSVGVLSQCQAGSAFVGEVGDGIRVVLQSIDRMLQLGLAQ